MSFCCSGSDGLVKLWTIKTNECVKTLDAHQDKVWGLHGSRKDDKMVTGSADSTITIWEVSRVGPEESRNLLCPQDKFGSHLLSVPVVSFYAQSP